MPYLLESFQKRTGLKEKKLFELISSVIACKIRLLINKLIDCHLHTNHTLTQNKNMYLFLSFLLTEVRQENEDTGRGKSGKGSEGNKD